MPRTNEINLEVFKDMIQKSTLNLALEFTRIVFKEGKMISKMITSQKDIITIIDKPNTLVTLSEHDEVEFNIGELIKPLHTAETILNGSDQSVVQAKIYDDAEQPKIILMPTHEYKGNTNVQQHKCSMVHSDVVDPYVLRSEMNENIEFFITFPIDNEVLHIWNLLKAYGSRYQKVYVRVKDNMVSFDSTDANNTYEDAHDLPLTKTDINMNDIIICFEYKNFCHLLNVCQTELAKPQPAEMFCSIAWLPQQETGFLYVCSEDKSEQYFLFNTAI